VNTNEPSISAKGGDLFISRATVSFSRTPLHGVSQFTLHNESIRSEC
jgi:hypothetical protein